MPLDSPIPTEEDFAKFAHMIGGLSDGEISAIVEQATDRGVAPWQAALELGKLDAADVDIIKILLAPRDSIPGYEVLGLIGRGGMGVVYRARQLSLNREVALKTILLSQLAAPMAAARFENEAQVLARVIHPHIVAAFDFGRHAGRLFLAMELVRGRDVQSLVEHYGGLPETLVWHVIRQAAAGLAHASKANIIHRDIKPANLLLVNPPDGFPLPAGVPMVKIADFGLSILGDDQQAGRQRLTSANVHIGSPTYMAPEQLESDDIDHAADIFALGATAWHMLAGRPPLAGSSLRQLVMQRLTHPTPPLSQHVSTCSPATSQLVEKMLVIDPKQRIRTYDELLIRIDGILAEATIHHGEQDVHPSGIDSTSVLTGFLDRTAIANADSPTQHFSSATNSQAPITISTGLNRRVGDPSADATVALSTSSLESLPTESVPGQTQSPRAERIARSKWLWLAALVLIASLFVAWRSLDLLPSALIERPATATGPRQALFDGYTLTKWSIVSGSWSPDVDAEGALVLQGTDGIIRRPLSDEANNSLSDHFAVEATCHLFEAASARFKLQAQSTDQELVTLLVEMQPETLVVFLQRANGVPKLMSKTELSTDPEGVQPLRGLRIEFQAGHWWIMLDGRVVSRFGGAELAELLFFELAAANGTAQFADLSVASLIARVN